MNAAEPLKSTIKLLPQHAGYSHPRKTRCLAPVEVDAEQTFRDDKQALRAIAFANNQY